MIPIRLGKINVFFTSVFYWVFFFQLAAMQLSRRQFQVNPMIWELRRPTGKDLGAIDREEKQKENQKSVGFMILKHFWKKICWCLAISFSTGMFKIKHTCRPELSIFSFQSMIMMLKIKILLKGSQFFKSQIVQRGKVQNLFLCLP